MVRLALTLMFIAMPHKAAAQCRLCAPAPLQADAPVAEGRPLTIAIETALDFSRSAQIRERGGSVAVDARSGARRVAGGLVDLGGIGLKGVVRLSGDPGRHVRVSLPASIALTAAEGGGAEVVDLETDLSPDAMLDQNGTLDFSFGGRLVVSGGASGEFRGRIPIVADYR